jgi:nitrogenase molybdenum-iron protein alpha chain
VEDIAAELHSPQLEITVAAGQPSEELVVLNRLRPDLYCGHAGANGWVARLGIPTLPLFGQALNYMGYSGAYELARKAAKAIKNTNFVRNISANVRLPLSQEWLARDTRLNIKETDTV